VSPPWKGRKWESIRICGERPAELRQRCRWASLEEERKRAVEGTRAGLQQ
jgi:hypothetical protein